MKDLEDCRNKVDEIDKSILKLIFERMKLSEKVAEFKSVNGNQVLDAKRESEVINNRFEMLKELGIEDKEFVQALYGVIMIKSKIIQSEYLKNKNN